MVSATETFVEVSLTNEKQKADIKYEDLTISEALRILETSDAGLSGTEAQQRLVRFGPNKLPVKEKSPILEFLKFLWNPLSWCMEVAAVISIILLDYVDFALIIILLLLNAAIGYREEAAAGDAIAALAASLAPQAKVLRDGNIQTIDASQLVPGDIVLVRLGDVIAADIKFIGAEDHEPLQIDQAALTGESLPVKRFAGQCAFSGSTVKQGESLAVVYGTGVNTFFGKAASLISDTDSAGHLQEVMSRIGAICIITITVWVIIELGVQFGYYNHQCSLGQEGSCPTLSNMLVIIVGGIPIAMPTVLSVTLAMGAYKLATKGAIVTRLTAIEELAGMDMLCSDKTGTLTLNQLSVDKDNLESGDGFTTDDILLYGALGAKIENEEPIDLCCHDAYGDKKDTLWDEYKCLRYVPFNPNDKRTIATIQEVSTGQTFRAAKGAPQVILQMSHNYEAIKDKFEGRILEYASRGYRALGVGFSAGTDNDSWEFVGLIPIFDPPRHDTKDTIVKCLELGIGVKMITGDQLPIGVETARQLGMGTNMYTTEVFKNEHSGLIEGTMTLSELVENADGFAEVFPEHKYDIVKRLQERGHITGMTGDGVNDAPALKKGDIGIAVADATDAARAAADIVLTEPGLGVIIDAIIGARKIFQRMKSYAKYTVAMTFRICFTFGLLTVLYDWYFPTILIVLLAIFNDGAMISLSKDRVTPSRNPDAWFLQSIFINGLVYGLYLTLSSWALFYIASHTDFFTGGSALSLQSLEYTASGEYCNTVESLLTGTAEYNQCVTEVTWERQSRLRALMYVQVSISGMALIFVTRTSKFSWLDRPGVLPMLAFIASQIVSSLIAGFGFNGWTEPLDNTPCVYCEDFSGAAPLYGTESVYEASLLGCGVWVIVAWVWAILWFIPLDFIKFAMAYICDGDRPSLYTLGIRTQASPISNPKALASVDASNGAISTGRPRPSSVVRGSIM
ncbi:plasma-membrane proton-efflux P-type ATPase [Sphaeroforma arctica JP610]|uniref:Plasma membrane ATPase n=1 Tax=Sphaeroforma arctica JP610 TaxID=667725 RepID=A0A0L0FVT1_9EUKA|nr:plasma-membrane proton-efflux P-type ATPase [Sphaeroforma arctica JP610]KNC80656.1 plasma-membrane proton-efflux P-type ATPase [Sphaeroforma arctica JP610]|eukprot:XP_014154558.1 plasma-membrane proton-efflux P-type ATPase [Sphaeroforma arctica JP610]